MTEIEITSPTIKLGQLVKLANFAETGGEAKQLIADGAVTVNGQVDTRRGKTLRAGDVIAVGGREVTIVVGEDRDDEPFDLEKWQQVAAQFDAQKES